MPFSAPDFCLRPARPSDAGQIARVHVDSWRTTYAGIVPQSHLDSLSVEARHEMWARRFFGEKQPGDLIVATDVEDSVVAFAAVGPSRDKDFDYSAEIYAIYSLAKVQGLGLGRRLFDSALEALRRAGHRTMSLWVLSDNPTMGFYKRMGGRPFASKFVDIGGVQLEETALAFDL